MKFVDDIGDLPVVRRPPRGGRGLKSEIVCVAGIWGRVAIPRRGANLFQKNPTKNRLGVTEITPSLFYSLCGYKRIDSEESGS